MARETDRNALCPCGSGRKFKRCCAAKLRRRQARNAKVARLLAIALALGAAVGAVAVFQSVDWGKAPPGKVWSEAHGHWHDAP